MQIYNYLLSISFLIVLQISQNKPKFSTPAHHCCRVTAVAVAVSWATYPPPQHHTHTTQPPAHTYPDDDHPPRPTQPHTHTRTHTQSHNRLNS